jgi:hypothetical protein
MKKVLLLLMLISSTAWAETPMPTTNTGAKKTVFTPEEMQVIRNLPSEELHKITQELRERIWRDAVLKELREINQKLSSRPSSTVKK